MEMKDGMLPRRSNKACGLMAPFVFPNLTQGNKERHWSIVDESRAQTASSSSMPKSASTYKSLTILISTWTKSAYIRQSLFSLASAKVLFETRFVFQYGNIYSAWLVSLIRCPGDSLAMKVEQMPCKESGLNVGKISCDDQRPIHLGNVEIGASAQSLLVEKY